MEENNIILFEEKSLEVMKKLKDLKTEKDRLDKIDEELRQKLQEKMNNMTSSVTGAASISKFDDIEAKANAMLDKANAMQELNQVNDGGIDDLMAKYDSTTDNTSSVDDELAALKDSLGL